MAAIGQMKPVLPSKGDDLYTARGGASKSQGLAYYRYQPLVYLTFRRGCPADSAHDRRPAGFSIVAKISDSPQNVMMTRV